MTAAAGDLEVSTLPPQILRELDAAEWQRVDHGSNPGRVYRIRSESSCTRYLKIHPRDPNVSLQRERDVIQWLAGQVRVPQVLAYESFQGVEYLLLSELPGRTLIDPALDDDSLLVARLLAKALRTLHAIDIICCPLARPLDALSREAAKEIDASAIAKWSGNEDFVLAHGDACLPNIVIGDAGEVGFIDLARAGVSDRYLDLACAVHTLRYNEHPEEAIAAFFAAYDHGPIDSAKLEFYTLLNKLI